MNVFKDENTEALRVLKKITKSSEPELTGRNCPMIMGLAMYLGQFGELTVERLAEILPEVLPARGWNHASMNTAVKGKSPLLLLSCPNINSTFRSEREHPTRPAKCPRTSTRKSRAGDDPRTPVKAAVKEKSKSSMKPPANLDAMDVDGM